MQVMQYEYILQILAEVFVSDSNSAKINGEQVDINLVRKRCLKIDQFHMEYITGMMKENEYKIRNIRRFIMLEFINTEDSIVFFPRRYEKKEKYEAWQLSHMDDKKNIYESVVVIKEIQDKFFLIYILTEDKNLKNNIIQITKIINLIHDIAEKFEIKIELVKDIYDNLTEKKIQSFLGGV